jgi:glycosyltransferase involved in cell wall biosynthesis
VSTPLPRITVVTPSFNQAPFLEQTILSVLGQCYPHLEYIVMDGGSTDGSREIIERYATQLADWQSQPDGGQATAINAGFARATGDILCWLNSDDYFLPGTLYRIARAFGSRVGGPALIYGSCLFFREGAAPAAKVLTAKPFDAARLRMTAYIIQPSAFWTRALWEKTGPLDETLHFGFDWDWFIRASAHAAFELLPEMLSAYRRHEDHKSGKGGAKRREEILTVVRRHASESVRACFEFAMERWPEIERWSARRLGFESRRFPAAGALARASAPALWHLPEGVSLEDLRLVSGMLQDT